MVIFINTAQISTIILIIEKNDIFYKLGERKC